MIYGAGCQRGQVAEYCMWLFYVVNIKKHTDVCVCVCIHIHIKINPEDLQSL
jgi:hypothetical protein